MADETDQQPEQPQDDEPRGQPAEQEQGQDGVGEPPRKLSGVELATRGKRHLHEMTGYTPETVSGLERVDDGWRLTVEVVELSRIPPSTDVLGTYELDLTEDGELASYRRSGRYHRSQAG